MREIHRIKKIAQALHLPNRFFVTFLDTTQELDTNNMEYPDIMMALANKLLEELSNFNIKINPVFYKNLENWFQEKILLTIDKKYQEPIFQAKIPIEHSEKEKELFSHLAALFQLSSLTPYQVSILKQFTILPSQEIPGEEILQVFSVCFLDSAWAGTFFFTQAIRWEFAKI